MEVLSHHHQRLRFQVATAAVKALLQSNNSSNYALDLSLKAPSASSLMVENSTREYTIDSILKRATPCHNDEGSNTDSELNSSGEDNHEANRHIKHHLPVLHENFKLQSRIGSGTFATVFLATLRRNPDVKYAIKCLTPTTLPLRVKKEAQFLKDIGGSSQTDNVCGIKACIRHKGNVAFVLPYIRHDKIENFILDMDCLETKLYMKNMLIALRRVHQFNVIHRDVKPANFLYDRQQKKYLLVDFGLAHTVRPEAIMYLNARAASAAAAAESSRKRKADTENSLSPNKKLCSPVKRAVLQAQLDTSKNIMTKETQQTWPKAAASTFQLLAPAPAQPIAIPNHPIAYNPKTSFIRVKNSRVKMMNTPLISSSQNKGKTPKCPCFNQKQLCELCLGRKNQLYAPRGGTPGYRPPEVLLKSLLQTTAVDMWAAGVVFLSILSGSYPFFRSPDDMTALSEIVTLFGSKTITEVALKLDRVFVCDKACPPLDLQKLCYMLRKNRQNANDSGDTSSLPKLSRTKCDKCAPSLESMLELPCLCPSSGLSTVDDMYPPEAYDLLKKMLDPNPGTRITAEQALQHPFLTDCFDGSI